MNESDQLIFRLLVDPNISFNLKKHLINSFNKKNVNSLCELVLNILNKNIPISHETYKKLIPYAKHCRKLLDKKLSTKEKKRILLNKGINQKGGFLQFIIPALLSLVGSVASTVISNAITKKQDDIQSN